MNKKANSVKSLQTLYTVIIGVALSSATVNVISSGDLSKITIQSVLLFLSFCITLIPFFHGAMRHLDHAYLENDHQHIRSGALLLDFLLLFVHGIVFVVLSFFLGNSFIFLLFLLAILFLDVIWGAFAHFASSSKESWAEAKWVWINLVFVLAFVVYLSHIDAWTGIRPDMTNLAIIITVATLLRTIVDYAWGWHFYFPED
jgi:hypothetical protein